MRTYPAYLSYNHGDVKFAAWLQRALENYRLPNEMASQFERFPMRPIFRDRADLRSSADLGTSLTDALARSSALIVVCSASAAASDWVDQEIEVFRKQHGAGRIFAIIARDEPPNCFPPALMKSSDGKVFLPMAADARANFDGRRDAFLKLVAGLLDVEFDALKRRDQHRKQRRMTAVTSASTLLAAAMLALAISASNARDEAQRRRAQADDLIGFMLGDLRARLEPIGRLDVLDAVGDKAMGYFADFQKGDLGPDSRLDHARALRQIGEVRVAQGNLASAIEAFIESNSQAQSIVRERNSSDALYELSQSHFWVGYAYYASNELEPAEIQFNHYLDIAQRLVDREPGNPAFQTEVAYAHSNLGTVAVDQNRFDVAESHFLHVADTTKRRLRANPGDIDLQRDLAETMSWLARVATNTQSIGVAASRYQEEWELRRLIAESTDDQDDNHALANTGLLLGYQRIVANQAMLALSALSKSLGIADRLVDHDPANANWRVTRADIRLKLSVANLILLQGGVMPLAVSAVAEVREITLDDSSNTRQKIRLIGALTQLARHARLRGDKALVRRSLDDVLNLLGGREVWAGADERSILGRYYLLEGDFADDIQHAGASWKRGLALLVSQETTLNPVFLLTKQALAKRLGSSAVEAAASRSLQQIKFTDTQMSAIVGTLVTGTFLTN